MAMRPWVRLPSRWIEDRGLHKLRWSDGGSSNTAALMTLMAIAHHTDLDTGVASMTYDALTRATKLSRLKTSDGLDKLASLGVLERSYGQRRSMYRLAEFKPARGWAMLPAKPLYNAAGRIAAFTDFRLRSETEMNALKLYFLFASRRDTERNMALISYDKIVEFSGLERGRIKAATSMLAALSLAYAEQVPSSLSEYGVANAYRLVGLEGYNHLGTRSRRSLGSTGPDPYFDQQ